MGWGAGAALTDPEAAVMAQGAESREGSSGPSQGAGGGGGGKQDMCGINLRSHMSNCPHVQLVQLRRKQT